MLSWNFNCIDCLFLVSTAIRCYCSNSEQLVLRKKLLLELIAEELLDTILHHAGIEGWQCGAFSEDILGTYPRRTGCICMGHACNYGQLARYHGDNEWWCHPQAIQHVSDMRPCIRHGALYDRGVGGVPRAR